MNALAKYVFLFVALFGTTCVQAQILERLKESVESAAKKEVENSDLHGNKRPGKVESEKPKSLTNESPSPAAPAEIDTTSGKEAENGGMFPEAKYESSYHFNDELLIEISTQEKKKKSPDVSNMKVCYGEKGYMNQVLDDKNKSTTKIIIDYGNNTSITLDDENKTGMAMSLNFMANMIAKKTEKTEAAAGKYTVTKTGNTKTIAGYLCDEYLMESDDMTANLWISKDVVITNMEEAKKYGMAIGTQMNVPMPENEFQAGTMLESHMVEKGDKGTTFDYRVKEVNKVDLTVNMADYEFMKMF